MPKEPMKIDASAAETEADIEAAAERVIEEAVPTELKETAVFRLHAILRETRARPLTALLVAAAVGYVVAVLTSR